MNDLADTVKVIKNNLENTPELEDQIDILERAITEERNEIGEMNYELMPNPNSPNVECQMLTEEQKKTLGEKAKNL